MRHYGFRATVQVHGVAAQELQTTKEGNRITCYIASESRKVQSLHTSLAPARRRARLTSPPPTSPSGSWSRTRASTTVTGGLSRSTGSSTSTETRNRPRKGTWEGSSANGGGKGCSTRPSRSSPSRSQTSCVHLLCNFVPLPLRLIEVSSWPPSSRQRPTTTRLRCRTATVPASVKSSSGFTTVPGPVGSSTRHSGQ